MDENHRALGIRAAPGRPAWLACHGVPDRPAQRTATGGWAPACVPPVPSRVKDRSARPHQSRWRPDRSSGPTGADRAGCPGTAPGIGPVPASGASARTTPTPPPAAGHAAPRRRRPPTIRPVPPLPAAPRRVRERLLHPGSGRSGAWSGAAGARRAGARAAPCARLMRPARGRTRARRQTDCVWRTPVRTGRHRSGPGSLFCFGE